MNKAIRYAGAAFAMGLLLAGLIPLLQNLSGERAESLALPCFLLAMGIGSGAFALFFPGFEGGAGACGADDSADLDETRSSSYGSELAGDGSTG